MRAGYGEKLRKFFSKYNPKILIDLGPGVFESATVDTNILLIQKSENKNSLKAITLQKDDKEDIKKALDKRGVILRKLSKDAWFIGSDAEQRLKEKIERIGKMLKVWDVKIYRGILTGLNEAFIITTEKRNEILSNCKDEKERERTEVIIKPILRGRDIKRYSYEWANLWVIVIPAGWTNEHRWAEKAEIFIEKSFPALMEHLKPYEVKAKKRDDQGDYWWELRHCAYYPEFEKEKVVWTPVNSEYSFTILPQGFYFINSIFMITFTQCKYFCAILNSKLIRHYLTFFFSSENEYTYASKENMEKVPIPAITPANESIVKQIENFVETILSTKHQNLNADISHLEREIDQLVYRLYDLTEEDIKVIEKNLS
jgi:type II restriction/modification system DNA methylase subunit YeeA